MKFICCRLFEFTLLIQIINAWVICDNINKVVNKVFFTNQINKMKTCQSIFISIFVLFALINAVMAFPSPSRVNEHKLIQTPQEDIQNNIYNTFLICSKKNNLTPLKELSNELEKRYNQKNENSILYWRSYLQFYIAIYYLNIGDKTTSEKEIDKGIDWMDKMNNKNAEDYALLALLQGFGIQFKTYRAMFISRDISKNLKKSLELDPKNLRAHYVYASNDFHTPSIYGGGKKAEAYLLKALTLPPQKIKANNLPSWGKEEAYELLVRVYIKENRWSLAKRYYNEGLEKFPESETIKKHAPNLAGK